VEPSEKQDMRWLVSELIGDVKPATLAVVGKFPALDEAGLGKTPEIAVTRIEADAYRQLATLGMQDLVLVGDTLEQLERRDGEALLAGLRDLFARRVIVSLQPEHGWQPRDLIAFGFTCLGRDHAGTAEFFGFDIATYKTTPDWLNARNWANPDLFDKFRW
jgi:hypothetical protein